MTWTKLSTQMFHDGTTVTKYLLDGSGGGVLKSVKFAEGSKMYNAGIGSTRLYSFKGKPLTLDVYTAEAGNGRGAGSSMFDGNLFEYAKQMLKTYIKGRS